MTRKKDMEIQPLKIGTKMAKVPVIQGGMGNGNQIYICNNANTTTTGSGASTISHSISLLK